MHFFVKMPLLKPPLDVKFKYFYNSQNHGNGAPLVVSNLASNSQDQFVHDLATLKGK
jgi:hypothetical protein